MNYVGGRSAGDSIVKSGFFWPPLIDYFHASFRIICSNQHIAEVIFTKIAFEASNGVIFERFADNHFTGRKNAKGYFLKAVKPVNVMLSQQTTVGATFRWERRRTFDGAEHENHNEHTKVIFRPRNAAQVVMAYYT